MKQRIELIGNLGQDPEMRYTATGQAVCNFSMATTEKWTGQDGQRQERTTWWKVAVWGKQGEACAHYLNKGRLVEVVGKIVTDPDTGAPRIWEDKDGNARTSLEINARNVLFLGSGGGNGSGNSNVQQQPEPEPKFAPTEVKPSTSPDLDFF